MHRIVLRGWNTITTAGLALSLVGPAAIAATCPLTLAQAALVALALAVIGTVRAERSGPRSLGISTPRASSLFWIAALVASDVYVFTPAMTAIVELAGGDGFAPGVAAFGAWPLWQRIAVVIAIPTIEDLLYRGYAIDRLHTLTGSRALAVGLSSICCAFAHVPLWGLEVSLAMLLPTLLHTAFYAWRRELAVNVTSHVVTDALGLFTWSP
jgi:membrane protease YdiL (CAAX protease family)